MVLHPVGPHEPRVYWTRRAVLLLAVVLVIVLLAAYACSRGGSHPSGNRAGTTPTHTPSPTSSTPSGTPAACDKAELSVAASTDATTYKDGVLPRLIATIRTRGTAACELPVSAITWEIVSGSDVIYATAGCPATSHSSFTVRPNHPLHAGRTWDRHRSVPDCTTPGAAAGPGTYQLHATVAGVRSAVAVFHLTG
jgi:hypothetical protein